MSAKQLYTILKSKKEKRKDNSVYFYTENGPTYENQIFDVSFTFLITVFITKYYNLYCITSFIAIAITTVTVTIYY